MEEGLKRSIGWIQGTAMAIGSVLGSGILILPAVTAEEAGPASLISWLLMAILALPLALTLGRLAARIPSAGGIAAYADMAFGSIAGRITGWIFLGTVPIGAPIVALVGANYLGVVFHLPNLVVIGLAAFMLGLSLLLNVLGVNVSTWAQVLMVVIIAFLLIFAIAAAFPYVEPESFHPFFPHGWIPVGMASVMIFWSFVGWEMVAHLAEEFRNPSRDILLSLGLAAIIVGVLYLLLAFVTIGTRSYGMETAYAPLSILVGKGFGQIAAEATSFLALLITFGGIHTNITGFSRMVYSQAREGVFPAVFARLHPNYKTPVMALAGLSVVFSLVLIIISSFHLDLGWMIQWPSSIFLVLYMIAMASALKLLSKQDIGWWMALVSLIVCLILYPFSGWASFYPPALILLSWLAIRGIGTK